MQLPEQVTENNLDDIQSIDFDIDSLYRRFIGPIEAKRSISAPNTLYLTNIKSTNSSGISSAAQTSLNNSFVDNSSPQESRASCFYRMLGLPIMDVNLNFFNGGFNPGKIQSSSSRNATIMSNPDPDVLKLQTDRETDTRKRIQIFQSSFLDSSVFVLGQQYTKKFQILKKSTFNDLDPQRFSIPDRQQFISEFYLTGTGEKITNFFAAGTHIIRPFLVNGVLDQTVMPARNMICAPFLKNKSDTLLENNIYLDRPGIEFILRTRLKLAAEPDLILGIVNNLDPNQKVTDISRNDLVLIASALLDKDKITDVDIFASLLTSATEIATINNLIKIIKGCVNKLTYSVSVINDVIKRIDWTPLPSELGPEDAKGMLMANSVILKTSTSELEKRIKQLNIKSILSNQSSITDNASSKDIGSFALSYFQETQKTFDEPLDDAIEQKNHCLYDGAQALRNIEIITGEVSGLGLVDILAIYTALWAIDLDVLLSLLDVESFQRLVNNNKELINKDVQKRINNNSQPTVDLDEAMQKFENQIINILDFADRLFDQSKHTTITVQGGSSPTS